MLVCNLWRSPCQILFFFKIQLYQCANKIPLAVVLMSVELSGTLKTLQEGVKLKKNQTDNMDYRSSDSDHSAHFVAR